MSSFYRNGEEGDKGMANAQQRDFRRNRKNYEKYLREKAELDLLNLMEKEEYQAMQYAKKRRELFKREKLKERIIGFGFIAACLAVQVGGEIKTKWQQDSKWKVSSIQQQVQKNRASDKAEIVEQIKEHMTINHQADNYLREGIQEYNASKRIGRSKVEGLQQLRARSAIAPLEEAQVILGEKIEKEVEILIQLDGNREEVEEINKKIEEVSRLNEAYQQSIYKLLDTYGIVYEVKDRNLIFRY